MPKKEETEVKKEYERVEDPKKPSSKSDEGHIRSCHLKLIYVWLLLLTFLVATNFHLVLQLRTQFDEIQQLVLSPSLSSYFLPPPSTTERIIKKHLKSQKRQKRSHDSLEPVTETDGSPSHPFHFSHSHHLHRHRRHRDHNRILNDDPSIPKTTTEGSVEFFPKPQPTTPTNGHVWLTSYSRIPLPVLEDFCTSSMQYCPGKPGPQGPPGLPGPKGDRGLSFQIIFHKLNNLLLPQVLRGWMGERVFQESRGWMVFPEEMESLGSMVYQVTMVCLA